MAAKPEVGWLRWTLCTPEWDYCSIPILCQYDNGNKLVFKSLSLYDVPDMNGRDEMYLLAWRWTFTTCRISDTDCGDQTCVKYDNWLRIIVLYSVRLVFRYEYVHWRSFDEAKHFVCFSTYHGHVLIPLQVGCDDHSKILWVLALLMGVSSLRW